MDKQAKQRAILQKLKNLPSDERVSYALELLDKERGIQIVSAALAILTPTAPLDARPILLRLYDYYDAAGIKRDPGSPLRSAILVALFPIANATDVPLAERAAMTYEFLPPSHEESVSGLRAAGLTLLSKLDSELAHYHSVRLLNDPHTSHMSGEPAVSAARHLADYRHTLPLYAYVLRGLENRESLPEVMGECLRCLPEIPLSVINDLLARYTAISPRLNMPIYMSRDDIELVGLFDLLLAHATRSSYLTFIEEFLRTTHRFEVFRYLVSVIVAQHQPATWTMLERVTRAERDRQKVEILLSAFMAVQGDPAVTLLLNELQMQH